MWWLLYWSNPKIRAALSWYNQALLRKVVLFFRSEVAYAADIAQYAFYISVKTLLEHPYWFQSNRVILWLWTVATGDSRMWHHGPDIGEKGREEAKMVVDYPDIKNIIPKSTVVISAFVSSSSTLLPTKVRSTVSCDTASARRGVEILTNCTAFLDPAYYIILPPLPKTRGLGNQIKGRGDHFIMTFIWIVLAWSVHLFLRCGVLDTMRGRRRLQPLLGTFGYFRTDSRAQQSPVGWNMVRLLADVDGTCFSASKSITFQGMARLYRYETG